MRTVWRFEIPVGGAIEPGVPRDARLLRVESRDPTARTVELWAEVDTATAEVTSVGESPRRFVVVGTGHEVPDGAAHIGSCLAAAGLVWHLYELGVSP